MKNLIYNFLKGFCIGTTILVYSIGLSEILSGDVESYIINEFIHYFILNIIFGIFIGVGLYFSDKNQNMDIDKRKKILQESFNIILGLIIACIIALIISVIFKYGFGILVSILFILALLIWLGGAKLGYKSITDNKGNKNCEK